MNGMGADVTAPILPYKPGESGLETVTGTLPEAATAVAGMLASSLVALTNVVTSGTPPKLTLALEAKLVPSPSSCNPADPTVVAPGLSSEIAGAVVFGLEQPHASPMAASNTGSTVLETIFI